MSAVRGIGPERGLQAGQDVGGDKKNNNPLSGYFSVGKSTSKLRNHCNLKFPTTSAHRDLQLETITDVTY